MVGASDPKIQGLLEEVYQDIFSLNEELDISEKKIEILKTTLHHKTQFGFIYSKNIKMQQLFILAEKYKDSSLPILIIGEKGCAKEALARAIHLKSNRRGPFLIDDSTQKLDNLLTHEDSTLYFADVSIVTPEKQKKIMECLHLASAQKTRIIVSTQKSAQLEPHLYHRLKPLTLTVVPLRERKEDILHLIDTFIREFTKNEKNISRFSSSALNKLVDYPWPGNVSELKLEIKRILIDFPDRKNYSLECLPEKIIGSSLKELFSIIEGNESLPKAMETLERKMVLESLLKHRWNKSKVSRELGISRSGLIQKVEKYHIRPLHLSKFSQTKRRMSVKNSSFMSIN